MSTADHIAILRDEAERLRDMTPELKAALTDPVETVRWALTLAQLEAAYQPTSGAAGRVVDGCPADVREALRGWVA